MTKIQQISVISNTKNNQTKSNPNFSGMIGPGSFRERIAYCGGSVRKVAEEIVQDTVQIAKKTKKKVSKKQEIKRSPVEQQFHDSGETRMDRLRSNM